MKIQVALIAAALLLLVASAYAHHPFAAEYDWTKPVTLNGTVTKFEWMNPHSLMSVDAKDAKGQVMHWTLEMGGPGALTRAGWKSDTVKSGNQVTVDAWLGKTDKNRANVKSVKLSDGRELSGASSILDSQSENTKPASN